METSYKLKQFINKQKGATLVEYAIMVALISVVSILVITGVGEQVSTTFSTVNSTLATTNG